METIWLVSGESNDWEDVYYWDVAAYKDEQSAINHVNFLNSKFDEVKDEDDKRKTNSFMRQFDPKFKRISLDHSCSYHHSSIELRDGFSQ